MTNNQHCKILVADIGGSHVTAAVYDAGKKLILKHTCVRLDVTSHGTAEHILSTWTHALMKSLELSNEQVEGLGVAMPGPFDYKQGISYITGLGKYEAIFEIDIKSVFANAFGLPMDRIIFRNDAEAVLAGEVLVGAGKGFNSAMGLTLGTGFGSSYASKGTCRDLNLGSRAFKDSIADNYFSTRWFLKRYTELTGKLVSGVKEIADLTSEDRIARQVFKEFSINLSVFLKGHVDELEPDILIIGGGISKAEMHFLRFVRLGLTGTRVVISDLGEAAALIGAAESFKL